MDSPTRFEPLRHAALAMLDAGNSLASVSEVLAVPVAVLLRWRDEPVPRQALPESVRAGQALRFDSTLAVRRSAPHGPWFDALRRYLAAVILAVAALAAVVQWRRTHDVDDAWVDLVPLAFALAWGLGRNPSLLVLDERAIVVPGLFGNKTLPYADLADWWLVMHVRHEGTDNEVEGRLLTLHSRRPGARKLELFIGDHVEIDPRVLERLDVVKQANQPHGPLTRLGTHRGA